MQTGKRNPHAVRAALIAALATLFVAALFLAGSGRSLALNPLHLAENKLYDLRFQLRGQKTPSGQVVIVAIDDRSIREIGHWPWTREKFSLLVDRLNHAGASLAVFDLLLSEEFDGDPDLRESIETSGRVLLAMSFDFEPQEPRAFTNDEAMARSSIPVVRNESELGKAWRASGVLHPLPLLSESSLGVGHVNISPDPDGTLRSEILYARYGDAYYPSLALQAARLHLGLPREALLIDGRSAVRLGRTAIPTDPHGRALINYLGRENTIHRVSAADLIAGRVEAETVRGKIAVIGITAVGLYDLRVTPVSENMPGVEKHAQVIENLLAGSFAAPVNPFFDLLAILAAGSLLAVALPRVRALPGAALAVTVLAIFAILSHAAFVWHNLWVATIHPLSAALLSYLGVTAYRYAVEERQSRQIRDIFSRYVSPKIVTQLIENPDLARLGGERRMMTVLFSDIRGFTSFSERNTPEEVVRMLNEYLGEMTDVVFRWDGTLDKFVGDAIVAFWGAPLPQENHAELALRCALHMEARLVELQDKWRREGKEPLDIGIGINTGEMVVGNMGAEGKKMDYTVIGDHVNLGARVEGLTRRFDTHIIITEYTYDKIRHLIEPADAGGPKLGRVGFQSRPLETVKVKGKETPVQIYEVSNLKVKKAEDADVPWA